MANDQIRKQVIFDFEPGKQTAVPAIKAINKELQATGVDLSKVKSETKEATAAQQQFNQAVAETNTSNVKSLADEMLQVKEAINASNAELRAFNDEARRGVGDIGNKVKVADEGFGRSQVGDISTASGAIASAVGGFGGTGAQQAGQLIGDVTGAIEYLGPLKDSVVSFGQAAGPAGIVVAAAAAGIVAAVAQAVSATKAMDQAIAASIEANADVERQIADGLTSDQIKAQIEENNRARQAEVDILEREKAARERANNAAGPLIGLVNLLSEAEEANATAIAEAEGKIRDFDAANQRLTQSLEEGEAAANDYAESLEKSASNQVNAFREVQSLIAGGLDTAALNEQIAEVNRQLKVEEQVREGLAASVGRDSALYKESEEKTAALSAKLGELSNATTQTAAAANTAKEALENKAGTALLNLGDIAGQVAEGVTQLANAELVRQSAFEKIADFDASRAESEAKKAIAAGDALVDARIKQEQKLEDRQEASETAAAQHAEKLISIEQQSQKAVEQLRAELAKGVDERLKAIGSTQGEIAALEDQYRKDQLKAEQEFAAAKLKINEEFTANALDAVAGGDFARLAELQRDRRSSVKELRTDFKAGQGEASEEFKAQKAALETKLADLQTELVSFQNLQAEKIKAQEATNQASIAAEEKRFQDEQQKREAAWAKADQREEQANQLREQRQVRNQLMEEEAAAKSLRTQIDMIAQKESAEVQSQLKVIGLVTTLDTSITGLAAKAAGLFNGAIGNTSTTLPATTPPILGFAEGGLVTKPTLALIGEGGKPELVMPVEPSKGLPPGLFSGGGAGGKGGGGNVTVNVEGTTITVQGSVDQNILKKIEKIVDASEIKQAKLFGKALHMIQDGKQPT